MDLQVRTLIFIGMRSFGKSKVKPLEFILKVEIIIPLWRFVSPDIL